MLRSALTKLYRGASRPIFATRTLATDPPGSGGKADDMLSKAEPEEELTVMKVKQAEEAAAVGDMSPLTDEELSERMTYEYIEFFKNDANDGWIARGAINDLMHTEEVPEPEVTMGVMDCCRRMNDYALAVRYLESLQWLMGDDFDEIWPWYHQNIAPTLEKHGIETPQQIGYDKPELYCVSTDNIH